MAVALRTTSSITACSRTWHASPKSTRQSSPRPAPSARSSRASSAEAARDAASSRREDATSAPSEPRRTSNATFPSRPRISASSSNPSGARAPSTSHATSAAYDFAPGGRGRVGVKSKRTARAPPGASSPEGQSHENRIAPSESSSSPSGAADQRNAAGSMVMFRSVSTRVTGTPTNATPKSTRVASNAARGSSTSARACTTAPAFVFPPEKTLTEPRYAPARVARSVHSSSISPFAGSTPFDAEKTISGAKGTVPLAKISAAVSTPARRSSTRHAHGTADGLRSVTYVSPGAPRRNSPKSMADCATTTSGP